MKTVILILICLNSLFGQNQFTFRPMDKNINNTTFIHLKFNPTIYSEGYQFEDFIKAHLSIEDYDKFVRAARFDSTVFVGKFKYVPVRVEIRGKKKDYSFAEFRELIWPNPKRRPRYIKS